MTMTIMTAAVLTVTSCAVLPLIHHEINAKERLHTISQGIPVLRKADFQKDGYRIVFDDEEIMNGEDLFDQVASGYPVNEQVYFYNGRIHTPKIRIEKTDRNGKIINDHAIDARYYTVEVPEGRKEIGDYSYRLKFKGLYAEYGTIEKKFFIEANFNVRNVRAQPIDSHSLKVTWTPYIKTYSNRNISGYSVSYVKVKSLKDPDWVVFRNNKTVTGNTKNHLTLRHLEADTEYAIMVRPYFRVNNRKIYGTWEEVVNIRTKK